MVVIVGINGFGRIGRVIFRTCLQNSDLEVAAINDPAIDVDYICYLIKFDSTHGKFNGDVTASGNEIKVNDRTIKVFHEKLPPSIPWQTAEVQYVIEASGMFTNLEKASGHLASDSVKRVIVTAPSVDVPMIILGVNQAKLQAEQKVISCASSTLYCLAPIIKILEDSFGVKEGSITSIHAMTPSLKPLDGLCLRGKHWRDHRSIHQNIIPATTGACKALGKILPQVKDKLNGLAFRVPIVNVSVLDLTIRLNKETTIQDIVSNVEKHSESTMANIIKCSKEEAVSSDFAGDSHSCILDVVTSLQLNTNFFKLVCWYENEYSYACRVVDSILFSETQLCLLDSRSKMTYVRPRLSKKRDMVQQTESCKNSIEYSKTLIECDDIYNARPKIINSTSQNSGLKGRTSRQLALRKPLSTHSSGAPRPSVNSRETKKKNEIFRIWNDENEIIKPPIRQNRNSFFHSCVDITPQITKQTNSLKAQRHLESVKKEFSKMVNMTEDLLKKSYCTKIEIDSSNKILKENNTKVNYIIHTEIDDKIAINNAKFNVSGDYSSIVNINSDSLNMSSRDKESFYDSFVEDISDHNIKGNDELMNGKIDHISQNYSTPRNIADQPENDESVTFIGTVEKNYNSEVDAFKKQVAKTINSLIDGLSQSIESKENDDPKTKFFQNIQPKMDDDKTKFLSSINDDDKMKYLKQSNETFLADSGFISPTTKVPSDTKDGTKKNTSSNSTASVVAIENEQETIICKNVKDMQTLGDSVEKVDIITSKGNTLVSRSEFSSEEIPGFKHNIELPKKILDRLNRFIPEPIVIISDQSQHMNPENPTTTISKGDCSNTKQDIYDKLDSASTSGSDNSFQIKERKSQIINITDLTNSLEDLARLDKICRIIEISDELSDKLFSTLDDGNNAEFKKKKWSFKDLCERIKLDEFCNKIFGK